MERDCDVAQKVYEMQQEVAEDAVRLKQAISKMCLVPKEQLNNTRSERDTVQSERDATREELKKAQRELISLQGEVQVQRAMNKKQRDQAVRIQEELAELRRGKENMGLQILEFETERAAAEEKIAELKERLAAADAAAQTALEAAKDDAEWNVSELKKRLVKAEAVAQQAVADLAASQSRSATAEELQEAEKINVELQYKLRAAETEKQRALSRLVVAQKELDMRDEADQAYTEREKAQYEAKRSRLIAVVESQQLEIQAPPVHHGLLGAAGPRKSPEATLEELHAREVHRTLKKLVDDLRKGNPDLWKRNRKGEITFMNRQQKAKSLRTVTETLAKKVKPSWFASDTHVVVDLLHHANLQLQHEWAIFQLISRYTSDSKVLEDHKQACDNEEVAMEHRKENWMDEGSCELYMRKPALKPPTRART